jgi:hypothetical protein
MTIFAKLRCLTEPRDEDLDQTFRRLADSVRNSGKTGKVQFTILAGDAARQWTLDLRKRDCGLQSKAVEMPDLEIITGEKTWWDIAEGRISPLDAFTQGRLRILGDTELGSHLLAVAGDGCGAVAVCEG